MKPVIRNFNTTDYVQVKLNDDFLNKQKVDATNHHQLEKEVKRQIQLQNGKVGYGGWLEKRSLYAKNQLFNQTEKRDIHLGYDFWCDAGSEVSAPIDGKVFSIKNNDKTGDYGPTLILEHQVNQNKIYTLYGHLSPDSLQLHKTGDLINAGQFMAYIGERPDNGDYVPHLHFQVMSQMLNFKADFPGVSSTAQLHNYLQVVLHPAVVLSYL